jgi:hypothetical protein
VTRQKPPRGRERPRFASLFGGQNPCRLRGVAPGHDATCTEGVAGFLPRLALTKPWYRILTNSWSEPCAVFEGVRGRLQLVENSRIIIRLCPSNVETTLCAGIGSSNASRSQCRDGFRFWLFSVTSLGVLALGAVHPSSPRSGNLKGGCQRRGSCGDFTRLWPNPQTATARAIASGDEHHPAPARQTEQPRNNFFQ